LSSFPYLLLYNYQENKEKFAQKYKDKKAQKENNLFITEFQNFTIV